jgi:hypothetical protein
MAWLSASSSEIEISVGSDVAALISIEPLRFLSSVSYQDPEGELEIGDETALDEDQDEGIDQEPA